MTNGTSQGLFIVIAIVIFGIFVGLSQTLFGKQLTNDLVALFEQSTEQNTFDKNKDYNVEDVIPSDESDFIFDGVNKIIGYKGSSTEVVIPNEIDNKKVTSISGDAFNNKGITKLIMPNTLTTIEDGSIVIEPQEVASTYSFRASAEGSNRKVVGAFANNTIEEISFSANLKYIGSFAFFSGELDDVILPEGLKSIGEGSFEQDNLSKINIPSTVENIGDNAFKDNNLTKVSYTNNSQLKSIGSNVFSGNNIESLKLPSGISNIKENAYSNSGLKNVTIPKGTQVIGKDAFSNNDLTSVEIPNGVTEIHENAFSNNQLTSITIPTTVEKIGKNSFSKNKLTEVTIPENVKEIEEGSFKENELTNVDLQEGLESIGDYAFYKNQLPVINLPDSVLNIGTYAFYENKLTNVKIPSKLSVIKEWSFAYNIMTEKPIIPSNVVKEESNAFYGNLFEEKITFKDANLGNTIATILGVSVDNITKNKLDTLTELDLSGKSIISLDGLENASNLQTLNARNNNIKDITLLTSMKSLTNLDVSNNNITTVKSIGNIKILNIATNPLDKNSSIYLEGLSGINLTIDKLAVSVIGSSYGNNATEWIVPITGSYILEVSGGQGGKGYGSQKPGYMYIPGQPGSYGSKMVGTFNLNKGEVLNLYQGVSGYSGAGGGESKIVSVTRNLTLLSAKGGKGGDSGGGTGEGQPGLGTNSYRLGTNIKQTTSNKTNGYASITRIIN